MNKKFVLLTCIIILITGCATTTKENQEPVYINDFPTRDRVEYVFNCIAKHGGDFFSYINRYACGCKIDKIAEKLNFAEYEAALTFDYLGDTPGEKGAVFRDPEQSKSLRTRLKEAESYAEAQCFVK